MTGKYYHEARIRVLKEQKKQIDEEIKKHRIRLASRGNSTNMVQVKKAQIMDEYIDGQQYMDNNRYSLHSSMGMYRMGDVQCARNA